MEHAPLSRRSCFCPEEKRAHRFSAGNVEMACLYIERLKSNFQQADHLLPRARNRKNWSPRFSTKCLPNQECDECCSCGKPRMKSVVVNLHTPAAPKICAIGLRRVSKDSKKSNPPFWNIVEVTKFLQRYLNVARRYFYRCSNIFFIEKLEE